LAEIKSTRSFEDMVLVKHGRLSVQPVKKSEFAAIVRMGRRK
jgi:predicted RNA-binding protein with PUA-like domain